MAYFISQHLAGEESQNPRFKPRSPKYDIGVTITRLQNAVYYIQNELLIWYKEV